MTMSEASAAAAAQPAAARSSTGTGAQPGGTGNQPGSENQPAGGSQSFTQEEVNRMIAAERRKAESKYADVKAKADKYDEMEEANKTELQKATDERDKWKSQYEVIKAERDRAEAVSKAAAEYGVDAEMLSRMSGDVGENAKYLKGRADAVPKYPDAPRPDLCQDFGHRFLRNQAALASFLGA